MVGVGHHGPCGIHRRGGEGQPIQLQTNPRWQTSGFRSTAAAAAPVVRVEGIGWLEAWGTDLPTALAALQALAAQRVAEADEAVKKDETP